MKLSVVAAALVLATISCSDHGPEFGTYQLISINGLALPFATQDQFARREVLSGSMLLNSDFTYAETTTRRTTTLSSGNTDEFTVVLGGALSITGDAITLTQTNTGATRTGTLKATTLTVTRPDETWTYRR